MSPNPGIVNNLWDRSSRGILEIVLHIGSDHVDRPDWIHGNPDKPSSTITNEIHKGCDAFIRCNRKDIDSLPSLVRSPEGNGVIERFFRNLREELLWLKAYDDEDELRQALQEFQTAITPTSSCNVMGIAPRIMWAMNGTGSSKGLSNSARSIPGDTHGQCPSPDRWTGPNSR